jgi:Na+/phosphate symporter
MMGSAGRDIGAMLRMVTDLEDITDDCFSLVMLLDKASTRKLELDKDEVERTRALHPAGGEFPGLRA